MEASGAPLTTAGGGGESSLTLVWIDAREAHLVSWIAGEAIMERLESDVPSHRKSTGHVGHDPSIRHGGGGRQQTAGETHRQEHLDRFVGQVVDRLAGADSVAIIGPGTVRERLERELRAADARQHRTREVATAPAGRLTERQLVARIRILVGDGPRRRTAGAYRWTGETTATKASGAPIAEPARVARKPESPGKARLTDVLAELQELMEPVSPESREPEEAEDA
jgi:hypothetical protein